MNDLNGQKIENCTVAVSLAKPPGSGQQNKKKEQMGGPMMGGGGGYVVNPRYKLSLSCV